MKNDNMGLLFFYIVERDLCLGTISVIRELHLQQELHPDIHTQEAYIETAHARARGLLDVLNPDKGPR